MVILKTQSQVNSYIKRLSKSDYNYTSYDIGSAWVDCRKTVVRDNKVIVETTTSIWWDDYVTSYIVCAIIRLKK
jgi:hypothetical protein